jgi:amino acid adenylation domain-containing protein
MAEINYQELPLWAELSGKELTQLAETQTPVEQASASFFHGYNHQIIEEYARKTPDRLAAIDEQEQVTYRDLNSQANQVARYLQRLGCTLEQPVGIYMDQSVRTLIGMLGVFKAGGAYVPISTRYPLARITTILEEAGISLVLTQRALANALATANSTLIHLDEDWEVIAQESQENLPGKGNERNLAYIVFTSGTTGKPKGVSIEHRSLHNLISWHRQAFQVTAYDKASLFASLSFDASIWESWPYLCSGACLHVVPNRVKESPELLRNWLVDNEITLCFLPTPLAEQMMKLEWPPTLSLRTLLTGGDRLHTYPPISLPFTLVNNYGPTENTVVATSCTISPEGKTSYLPSIGKPINNVEIYLLNEQLQPVLPGETGEIYLAGANLARGYYHQPALTKERFLPHPFSPDPAARCYKTGDLAQWDAHGMLTFLGRNDQQVKIRGFRIEIGEIHARLASHPAIAECCVMAKPVNSEENQLLAFVVPSKGALINEEALRAYLLDTLPDYMIPARFIQMNALPLQTSGKVDLQQLASMNIVNMRERTVVATTNEVERQLLDIWIELLPDHQFGLHDNFFTIGGHSLSVLQLIVRVRQLIKVSITVRDIYQAPTIAQLSLTIQQKLV